MSIATHITFVSQSAPFSHVRDAGPGDGVVRLGVDLEKEVLRAISRISGASNTNNPDDTNLYRQVNANWRHAITGQRRAVIRQLGICGDWQQFPPNPDLDGFELASTDFLVTDTLELAQLRARAIVRERYCGVDWTLNPNATASVVQEGSGFIVQSMRFRLRVSASGHSAPVLVTVRYSIIETDADGQITSEDARTLQLTVPAPSTPGDVAYSHFIDWQEVPGHALAIGSSIDVFGGTVADTDYATGIAAMQARGGAFRKAGYLAYDMEDDTPARIYRVESYGGGYPGCEGGDAPRTYDGQRIVQADGTIQDNAASDWPSEVPRGSGVFAGAASMQSPIATTFDLVDVCDKRPDGFRVTGSTTALWEKTRLCRGRAVVDHLSFTLSDEFTTEHLKTAAAAFIAGQQDDAYATTGVERLAAFFSGGLAPVGEWLPEHELEYYRCVGGFRYTYELQGLPAVVRFPFSVVFAFHVHTLNIGTREVRSAAMEQEVTFVNAADPVIGEHIPLAVQDGVLQWPDLLAVPKFPVSVFSESIVAQIAEV